MNDDIDPPVLITEQQGENFTHRSLWSVVGHQIKNAEDNPVGSFFNILPAMMFALLAFEAYLNFLGERLASAEWADERNFFKKQPYRGFDGRVRFVLEHCEIPEPDRTERPYSTIWELKDLRDLIAHGKVERISRTFAHSGEADRPAHTITLHGLATYEKACRARDDVHAFALKMHQAAKAKREKAMPHNADPWFGNDPFEGARGYLAQNTRLRSS